MEIAGVAAATGRDGGGWIRGVWFDQAFVLGTAVLALTAGALVEARPHLFGLVVTLDIWMLGYHHVVATYTRVAFDGESLRQHRFLVTVLPVLVVAAVSMAYVTGGPPALTTILFYWQWWHYARQGYGVERMYLRAAGGDRKRDRLTLTVIYGLPLWGLLARSAQGSAEAAPFLGNSLWWLPVPHAAADAAGGVMIVVLALWVASRVRGAKAGARLAHTIYVASHAVVFVAGYVLIERIDHGWLVVNVWHSAQYIFVVWLFNANRFKAGVDPNGRFLSTLSQPRAVVPYVAVCMAVSTTFYLALGGAATWLAAVGWAAPMVVVYASITLHHYVVDAVLWKLRKPAVRAHLGLPAA